MAAFTALAIAGLAVSAYGAIRSAHAQKQAGAAEQKAAESQAQLSEYNAAVADVQAQDAIVRGDLEANRFRSRTRQLVGEQRASFAAGNVDVGFGSAADVQADATLLGELDAITAHTNAARAAWGFRVEGQDQRKRADIQRKEGANAAAAGKARATAGYIGAAGTVVSGSASLVEAKYGMSSAGKYDRYKGIPYA